MSQHIIRAALESRLAAWAAAQVPPLRVAYENATFQPPDGQDYLRAFLIPAATQSGDMAGKHREWRGVFQVTAVTQPGRGSGRAGQILAELDSVFPVNLSIVREGLRVRVQSPANALTPDDTGIAYELPISIGYQAQTYLA